MKIIKEEKDKVYSIFTKEINLDDIPNLSSKTVKKIFNAISEEPMYPKQIAKQIKEHEQSIYYYIKKLEKAGLIKVERQESINGTIANYYTPASDSFHFRFAEFKESSKIHEKKSNYLEPFIVDGNLDALIVVGSPDPHGPQKARSRDGYYGVDLGLFLGTFLTYIPQSMVKLDTEVTDKDLENNLIIIGGPIVNKVSSIINKDLPVRFDPKEKGIKSKLSGRTYFGEEIGIINKIDSPFTEEKKILSIEGVRYQGTRAAILAFLKHFDELTRGNNNDNSVHSRVVEGVDLDSDGRVDDVEFIE